MSRRRYELAPEARQQLEAIGDYIAEDSLEAALKVLDALEESSVCSPRIPVLVTPERT